jgi:hypothetical protein
VPREAIGAAHGSPVPPALPLPRAATVRPRRWLAVGLWAAVCGAVGIVLFVNPSESRWLPRCAFHSLTGLNCPGCGATRALFHLVHGRILTALRCNAFFVLALPFLAYAWVSVTLETFGGRRLPAPFLRARWIYALAAAIVLFAVLRNVPRVPFVFLSPP